ncbi:LysE family translocator [Jannaschia sp.]|nr:LysE family translocator [Jannaschia sp.]
MSDIAPFLPGLFAALGVFAMGFLVIGPNIAAIMATSMAHGRRRGLAMACGVALGSIIWATLTVMGLASIITAYAGAVLVLKLFGAAFLLWLAVKALRSAASAHHPAKAPPARGNAFLAGLAIQMTNPKAALSWIAVASIAMNGNAPWQIAILLVALAGPISLLGHAAYATLFSTRAVVAGYARARRWIEGALGAFFTFAAWRLATERT